MLWLVSKFSVLQQAVMSAYRMGNNLIVGWGGKVILRDYPGTLHVRMENATTIRVD